MFLLNILFNLGCFRKCCFASFKKVFPMLVSTFWLNEGLKQRNARYMKSKCQKKIILNYIFVHLKENLNLVFTTTQYHFEIEVMKWSFQSTFGNRSCESKNYNIRWKLFMYATPYKCVTKRCDLCLTEKYVIACADLEHLLNKRTEIISKCCHRNKYLKKDVK